MMQHMSEFPSFQRLNRIPLDVYTFCLSIHPDGYLCYIHLLAIVNKASMHMNVGEIFNIWEKHSLNDTYV